MMRKLFAIAGAAVALTASAALAPAASATTFVGDYNVTYNNADPGLVLQVSDDTPGAGTGYTFNLANVGDFAHVDLFDVWTDESVVNWATFFGDGDDVQPKPISVSFNFTQPENFGGSVSGVSGGAVAGFLGFFQDGYITWNNDGNQVLDFGNGGQLQVHLDNAEFNNGTFWGLDSGATGGATITAKFSLLSPSAAVPEPMTWAMMLVGMFGLGAVLRAHRRSDRELDALSAA